jgi:hypothetical protein
MKPNEIKIVNKFLYCYKFFFNLTNFIFDSNIIDSKLYGFKCIPKDFRKYKNWSSAFDYLPNYYKDPKTIKLIKDCIL